MALAHDIFSFGVATSRAFGTWIDEKEYIMKGFLTRAFFYALTALFLPSVSGCGQNPGAGVFMLDSFEGELSRKTVDYGSAANSSLDVAAAKDVKMCGGQSIRLQYKLEKDGYLYCARGYGLDVLNALWEAPAPEKIEWDDYGAIRLQMYGQGQGEVAFDVKDAGGEVWRSLINDTTKGWREVKVLFTQFAAREDWQPSTADGNRKLDLPIKSFQFEPKTPGEGMLYFDCVQLVR